MRTYLIIPTILLALASLIFTGCNKGSSSSGGSSTPTNTRTGFNSPTDDHGDTPGFASTLNLSITTQGEIESSSDEDHFVFVASGSQTGRTYEVQLTATKAIGLHLTGFATRNGTSLTIPFSTQNAGPIYLYVTADPSGSMGSYEIKVVETTPATPAPPTPTPSLDPIRVEGFSSFLAPREVPATANSNLMQFKVIAQVNSVSITTLSFQLQRAFLKGGLNVTLRDKNGNYTGYAYGVGDLPSSYQNFNESNGNSTLFHLANAGDYAEVYLNLDVQSEDMVNYLTRLMNVSGIHAGTAFIQSTNLEETVHVEALANLAYPLPTSTISTVTSGTQFAPVTKMLVVNRSNIHTSEVEQLYVYRMTTGDQAPLSITLNGFLIASGQDYSYQPVTPGPFIHYVVFNIPAGLMPIQPLSSIEFTVEADMRNTHVTDTEYQIRSVVSRNDNDQRLHQSIYYNTTLNADTTFTVRQQ